MTLLYTDILRVINPRPTLTQDGNNYKTPIYGSNKICSKVYAFDTTLCKNKKKNLWDHDSKNVKIKWQST